MGSIIDRRTYTILSCAASLYIIIVFLNHFKYSCISCIAVEPSPTPAAILLIEPWRTSPAVNMPGIIVSSKNGCRYASPIQLVIFWLKKRNWLKGYLLSCTSGMPVCLSSGSTLIGLLKSKLCLPSSWERLGHGVLFST